MFMSYIVYSGLTDLRDVIREELEGSGYKFVPADTPEETTAVAESGGEYIVLCYFGGDFASVTEMPQRNPKTVLIPRDASGEILGRLAAELIRSYIEDENSAYIAELEADAKRLRDH